MAGIYIHIPFCKRRCSYCDFYSVVNTAYADRYVDAIIGELSIRKNEISLDDVRTIYIGGGTPSVLTADQLGQLLAGIKKMVDFNRVLEVTIEVNPDDVTEEYMYNVKQCGVNRVSIGIQSFVDSELKAVNRRHNAQGAVEAVARIKRAGIDNISIDLIYGLPEQTIDTWRHSIDCAIGLGVNHISAYCLSYEEGTALTKLRDMGKIREADDDMCVMMYDELCSRLSTAGYDHYEISNFALPEMYSKHNSSYWNGSPYLGLGAAAHSYDGMVRRYNPQNIKQYLDDIERGVPAFEEEQELWWQRYNETVMVRLRTRWGISLSEITREYGNVMAKRFAEISQQFVSLSMMERDVDDVYRLTRGGVMMSDAIIRELMYVEDGD